MTPMTMLPPPPPPVAFAPGQATTVTIVGGQVRVPTGGMFSTAHDWRDHAGVDTVTVAECTSTPIELRRSDKPAGGLMIYATLVQGIIYVSPYQVQGCGVPFDAQSFPTAGRYPLTLHGYVQNATIRTAPY